MRPYLIMATRRFAWTVLAMGVLAFVLAAMNPYVRDNAPRPAGSCPQMWQDTHGAWHCHLDETR